MSDRTDRPTQILPAITDDMSPEPAVTRPASRGSVIAVGASVVALVVGVVGGYLFGSDPGRNDNAAAQPSPTPCLSSTTSPR